MNGILASQRRFFYYATIMGTESAITAKIRRNVLFQKVNKAHLFFITKLKERKYPDGKVIFKDQSEGKFLYLILSGSIKISKVLKTGEEIVLGILHEGDFFGEIDLIDRRRRSAQATALKNCTIVCVEKKQFDRLMRESHAFVLNMLQMATLRLRSNNVTYALHQESNITALRRQLANTHQLIEASKIVNSSLDVDQLLDLIFQTAAQTVGADRGTLYLLDHSRKELWSKVQKGSSKVEIRLPVGTGIAGSVAADGKTINIADAYEDKRFNPCIDQITGYRTKATLCVPMKNRQGTIVGVFQLLNKTAGKFTIQDEEFIDAFSVHATLALENAQLAQRMIQDERFSAVGRMASSIIHDIKNPMGVLRLSAQVMKSKAKNHETTKLAEEMIHQIDRFIAMTHEILDFVRGVSSTNLQNVDFEDFMNTAILFIEKELENKNVKLVKNFNYTGMINVDADKLIRVFYNIVGNACDAMPKNGKLIIATSRIGDQLIVEFIDNGHGMDDQVKAKVLDPFFTYGKKHGTGLGMAIVKKIMEDHDGTIEIKSKVGEGTTIRLSFPLH